MCAPHLNFIYSVPLTQLFPLFKCSALTHTHAHAHTWQCSIVTIRLRPLFAMATSEMSLGNFFYCCVSIWQSFRHLLLMESDLFSIHSRNSQSPLSPALPMASMQHWAKIVGELCEKVKLRFTFQQFMLHLKWNFDCNRCHCFPPQKHAHEWMTDSTYSTDSFE